MNDFTGSLRKDIEKTLIVEDTPPEITPNTSRVSINIDPAAVPVEIIKHVDVVKLIFETFRSSFDTSQISLPSGAEALSPQSIISHQISRNNVLIFKGGFVDYGDEGIISINHIAFGSQTLAAEVYGTTKQAEYICKRLGELLWLAVGRERKWSEISSAVNVVSYSTSTVVKLGFSPRALFSEKFERFIGEAIEGVGGFGRSMGSLGQKLSSSDDVSVIVSCRELDFEVSVFDGLSGSQESCKIHIIPDTKHDNNRETVKILSELPYDLHVEMVSYLINKIIK